MPKPAEDAPGHRRVLSGTAPGAARLSLTDVCVQALTDAIEQGVYQPGSPLPSETDLAEQLEVSRATLREALRTLEDRQLIIRRHGRGTFVSQAPIVKDLHRNFGITAMIRAAGYHPATTGSTSPAAPPPATPPTNSTCTRATPSPPCAASGSPTNAPSCCPPRSCPPACSPPADAAALTHYPPVPVRLPLPPPRHRDLPRPGRAHPRQSHRRTRRRPRSHPRRPAAVHQPGRLRRHRKGRHVLHRAPPPRLGPLHRRAHRPRKRHR